MRKNREPDSQEYERGWKAGHAAALADQVKSPPALFEVKVHYLDGHSATLTHVEGFHTKQIGVWTFFGEGPEVCVPVENIKLVCMGTS